ncbi:hypothetical protein [Micromonospora chersina]|uniref:hypothetical protein n=1 Tax=Micromonospora chersina TaxID=47854 RepID=UPI0037222C81
MQPYLDGRQLDRDEAEADCGQCGEGAQRGEVLLLPEVAAQHRFRLPWWHPMFGRGYRVVTGHELGDFAEVLHASEPPMQQQHERRRHHPEPAAGPAG